jgi:hypothetical protein
MESDDVNKDQKGQSIEDALSEINALINTFATDAIKHPGFMWTPSGFQVLHADWPAYPRGSGLFVTLKTLSEYPKGTEFYNIDNIDQCTLFVVGQLPAKDKFSSNYLHIALWDEDLRDCQNRSFITGVEEVDRNFLSFPNQFIELTYKGENAAIILELTKNANEKIISPIIDFLFDEKYDTAVRETALRLELFLRETIKSDKYGVKLLEQAFREGGPLVPSGIPNSSRLMIRSSFISYFKYVRNEYAHKIPTTDLLSACRLISRSSELYNLINRLSNVMGTS